MHIPHARLIRGTLLIAGACAASLPAWAQVTVTEPWVRATVPQQKATGAFMQITSVHGGKLVAAASPVAGVVEIHEMAMQGNVMHMRAVPSLALPAGKPVELKPGGYHVMLMDLKAPVTAGQPVHLTLTIESADGKREQVEVDAAARAIAGAGAQMHQH